MIKKFKEIKAQYPDVVLLFRCGNIYECYYEDAQVCQDILGITASDRNGVSVSGFPFDALDSYLPKLVRAGKRVAICDEIETKEQIVKRECDMTKGKTIYMRDEIINTISQKLDERKSISVKVQFDDDLRAKSFDSLARATTRCVWMYHDVVSITLHKSSLESKDMLYTLHKYLSSYIKNIVRIVID